MPKGTLLPNDAAVTTDDVVTTTDMAGPTTKKSTWANIISLFAANFSNGTVSTKALTNPYKFSVVLPSDQSLSSSTWTKVSLSVENFDTGNNFDSVTNFRFTAPIAGFYFIQAQVGLSASGMTSSSIAAQGAIYKNGSLLINSSISPGNGSSTQVPRPLMGSLLQLAANDYIELYANIGEAGRAVQGGTATTFMNGFLVSTT